MPVLDSSILAQIPDMAPNPVAAKQSAYKLADVMDQQQLNHLQLGQVRQQIKDRDTTREVLKTADLSTPRGATQAAEQLARRGVDPTPFMKEMQQMMTGQGQLNLQQYELLNAKADLVTGSIAGLVNRYEDLRLKGVSDTDARAAVNPQYIQELQRLGQMKLPDGSPALWPQDLQLIQQHPTFDPEFLKSQATNSKAGMEQLRAGIYDRRETTQERGEALREKAETFKESQAEKKAAAEEKSMDSVVDLVGTYRYKPPQGYSSRSPYALELMAKVKERYPNYDANIYDRKHAAILAFAKGPEAKSARSLNVVIQHLDTLSGLSDALHNQDVKRINAIGQQWNEETGEPAPTNFDAAKAIVAKEVIKAIIAGGGGVTERQDAEKEINRASSPRALAGVIKTWKALLAGQLRGLKKQYTSQTGLSNFDDMLDPATVQELEGESATGNAPKGPDYSHLWMGTAVGAQPQ